MREKLLGVEWILEIKKLFHPDEEKASWGGMDSGG